MPQITRREFVGSCAAFMVLPFEQIRPDLVLYNGNVYTCEANHPRAQAVGISGERIFAVGSSDDVMAAAGPDTKRVDLGGKTVVPGFIDAHSHPASAGLQHLQSVDCDLRSIREIQEALRQRAAKTPPGEWVLGFKYDDTKTSDGRFLTLADLDAASTQHPIIVEHRGGHTGYVNSAALKKAGVTQQTEDPAGGHFNRDANGQLTGKLEEKAVDVVTKHIPSKITAQQRREGVALIAKMMTRTGVTSVHDAYGDPDDLVAFQDARDAGELLLRINCFIGSAHIDRMIASGARTGLGDDWVRIGPMKQTCDGSISERTARLAQPYVGRPDYYGIIVTPEETLYERARKAHAAGWQNAIHANGEVGIDTALRVFERLQKEMPRRDRRYRIEHCTVITPELIRRMRALGVIPNPFSTYVYYHGEKMREYGGERLERMFAVRSFLDAGLRVTMTSDYPPGPFEPMMALQSMVTRTDYKGQAWGVNQRVSVEEALRVGTINGAYSSYEENVKGSLKPGKLADLVVLGQDPAKVDPSTIIKVPVERTMVGGRWVFEA